MARSANRAGSANRATRPRISPSTQASMGRKLAWVEQQRAHAPGTDAIARLLHEMQSSDEQARARAVRQVCPRRLPWEVFYQVRSATQRLQHDPNPLVRANARHVEEDAWELAALEALHDWTAEHDEGVRAIAHRLHALLTTLMSATLHQCFTIERGERETLYCDGVIALVERLFFGPPVAISLDDPVRSPVTEG